MTLITKLFDWWNRQDSDMKQIYFVVGVFLGLLHAVLIGIAILVPTWGPIFPLLFIDIIFGLVAGLFQFADRMFPDHEDD